MRNFARISINCNERRILIFSFPYERRWCNILLHCDKILCNDKVLDGIDIFLSPYNGNGIPTICYHEWACRIYSSLFEAPFAHCAVENFIFFCSVYKSHRALQCSYSINPILCHFAVARFVRFSFGKKKLYEMWFCVSVSCLCSIWNLISVAIHISDPLKWMEVRDCVKCDAFIISIFNFLNILLCYIHVWDECK